MPDILASIDAGKPVLSYGDSLDMAVILGYREGGNTLLLHDYHAGDILQELPAVRLGWLQVYLGEFQREERPRDAVLESLRIAVRNARRETGSEGPGEYWYGEAALVAWMNDLTQVETLDDKEREKLFFVSWWNCTALVDARRAAVDFLLNQASLLDKPARAAAEGAAALYQREIDTLAPPVFTACEAFYGPWSGKTMADWTVATRDRERALLSKARTLESAAIEELEKALA